MLSFEEKIIALSLVRTINLSKATMIFSKIKRTPSTVMREELNELDRTHYLLDDGIVEKTQSGIIQYVEFTCPQQPIILTLEYFNGCKKPKQDSFMEALTVLRCMNLLTAFKPTPIVKKQRFIPNEENQSSDHANTVKTL